MGFHTPCAGTRPGAADPKRSGAAYPPPRSVFLLFRCFSVLLHFVFLFKFFYLYILKIVQKWLTPSGLGDQNRGTPSAFGDQNRGTPSAQVVLVLGTFLAASWEALGGVMEASWAGKVANMAPTWPQVGAQNGGKIRLGPSWRRLGSLLEASCSRFYAFLMHFCCMP